MSTITRPDQAIAPVAEANKEGYGYLQMNFEGIPHTGVDSNYGWGGQDEGFAVRASWDGVVVAAIPKLLYSWGRLVVSRHVLPYDVTSAGLLIPKGTVVYARYAHLLSFSVWKGQKLTAGQTIGRLGGSNGAMKGDYHSPVDTGDTGGEWSPHLHLDLRNGGKGGMASWDAGNEDAVQEWPSVRRYGYPAVGTNNAAMLRAVALRFIDPNAAIPAGRQPNASRCPRVF